MRISWLAAWLIIVAIPPPTKADESAAEGWKFSITPYVWMTGLEGQVGVRGITAAVDASFIDILRRHGFGHRIGGAFRGEIRSMGRLPRWDVDEARGGWDSRRTRPRYGWRTELALVEFGGLYHLGEWSLGHGMSELMAEGEPRLGIDVYVGGRLTYLDVDLGVNRAPPPDRRDVRPH